ncbi:MAG: histidine--tRNA ligase [Actinomycetota bacterium]
MPSIQAPRGAPDILPPRSGTYERVVRRCEDLFRAYGYRRIETPAFEHTEVFERGLEAGSDIVVKEMYTFADRKGRSLTLRPEGTAPIVRAVIDHGLDRGSLPIKLYYTASMFRYERPQAGRQRAFLQVGVEALGSPGPEIDAEVVELGAAALRAMGLSAVNLHLNSIGHPVCRGRYLPELVGFLEERRSELCGDCRRKVTTNPLRTFDCKVERDREVMRHAPRITDYLCAECRGHFDDLQGLLGDLGVAFTLDPRLVRGLDYYTRTTFSFVAAGLGAQNELGGGGRYDGLSEQLGGGPLPGIGFALGVDRIALALEGQGEPSPGGLDVFVVTDGQAACSGALLLASKLRADGLSVDLDYTGRGLKGQFRAADRAGARRVVVVGDPEASTLTVRNMATGEEAEVPAQELGAHLRGGG